jgi:hypothetical protein
MAVIVFVVSLQINFSIAQHGLTNEEVASFRKLARELDPFALDQKKTSIKAQACRAVPRSLVGLSYDDLVARCGLGHRSTTMASVHDETMVLQYEGLQVFLTNNVVTMASAN